MLKVAFFCCLVLSIPFLEVVEARRSGGGGSRGSSAARTSSGGGGSFSPNRGGGSFSPNHGGGQNFGNRQPNFGNQGRFNQPGFNRGPPQYNYPKGFNQNGWNRSPGFSSGSGLGSVSRASTFKHALAGAAIGTIGGLLAFEAGKAIINSMTTPFHHAGRDYYFDQQNYRGPSNVPRCSVPVSQLINTQTPSDGNATETAALANLQFRDGTRPKEVVWSCNVGEVCCGTDCCPVQQQYQGGYYNGSSGTSFGWIIFIIMLILLISCCIGCFCVYKFCRSTIENFLPSRSNQNQQAGYYDDSNKYDYAGQPSQSYPMNQYPPQQNNYYPPPSGYPPNPGPRY